MVFTKFHAQFSTTFARDHGKISIRLLKQAIPIYLYSQGKNQEKVLGKNTNGVWALGDPLQWGW